MNLDQIRKLYAESGDSISQADLLFKYLEKNASEQEPILLAYYAAGWALKARNTFFNVFSKLEYMRKSSDIFAKAVSLAPRDIEIRFIRFSIQINTPVILGFSPNIDQDKKVILEEIEQADKNAELIRAIANYLRKSGYCQQQEIVLLKDILER